MVEMSLAEYREQLAIQRETGAELERERIIKLLETLNDPSIPLGELYLTIQEVGEITALIKGKNK